MISAMTSCMKYDMTGSIPVDVLYMYVWEGPVTVPNSSWEGKLYCCM